MAWVSQPIEPSNLYEDGYTDEVASRAMDTEYTSGNVARQVNVVATPNAGTDRINLQVKDGSGTYRVVSCIGANGVTIARCVQALVPPGTDYKVVNELGTWTPTIWTESDI